MLNFTVTSKGRQFDRLALMYLNDTEVFRTSTAEPTLNGIVWTYSKDMSALMPLFKEPQKVIFSLDNNVDDTYTGSYNATLSATYFSEDDVPAPADMIMPVSARNSSQDAPSAFRVPMDTALNNLTFPRNVKKAIFTMSSCGQADEEFWWSNVPSSTTGTFGNASLLGFSPFREVQLLIDGQVAGVSWPFPVIFTGGVVPGFWRPIAGIDAFDLKEDEIDISPWIPLLADGKQHAFEMRVVGIDDDGLGRATLSKAVGDNWVVTGKVFLWLDEKGNTTTGTMSVNSVPDPELHVVSQATAFNNGTNSTLSYSVLAQRNLWITAKIRDSDGEREVTWRQSLSYSNSGNTTEIGNTQVTSQMTSGAERSSSGYARRFSYPLWTVNSFTDDSATGGNMTISGKIDRSRDEEVSGRGALNIPLDSLAPTKDSNKSPTYSSFAIRNRQNATAFLSQNMAKNLSTSDGETQQVYFLNGLGDDNMQDSSQTVLDAGRGGTELYKRNVIAKNAVILNDEQTPGGGKEGFIANDAVSSNAGLQVYAFGSIQDMLERGPLPGGRRRNKRMR